MGAGRDGERKTNFANATIRAVLARLATVSVKAMRVEVETSSKTEPEQSG